MPVELLFSDDSKYIAITCNSSSPNKEYTKIWDLTSGKTVNTITTKSVGPMAFHPDGKSLLITKGVSRIGSFSHEPFFIDILTGREVFHYRGPSLRHVSTIFSVALIPGGKKFVATGIDGHVYVWSVGVKEGKIIKTLPHWGKDIEAFPDGKHIAVACADGNVYILDLDGKTIATLKANRVEEIAISRDGNRLVVAPYDATDPKLTLWYVGHHF